MKSLIFQNSNENIVLDFCPGIPNSIFYVSDSSLGHYLAEMPLGFQIWVD